MYLEHTKSKLGSANAKIHTGKSEVVKRLHRKTGGSITRTKHAMGDCIRKAKDSTPGGSEMMKKLHRKTGGSVTRTKHANGGMAMTPSPAAAKFAHKKGSRVKREHHFLGALLGAASAIPSIIDLFRRS